MRHRVASRTPALRALRLAVVGASLVFAGCAGVLPPVSYVGPAVSPAAEAHVLAVFQERAGQFRRAVEERVRTVGARLLAVMKLGRTVSFGLIDANDANAYVEGGTVRVTLGLVRLVKNDDELALAVGHELGHLVAVQQVGAGRLSAEDQERLADYYGLIGLHRAGYDILTACELWMRMATELTLEPTGRQATDQLGWMTAHPSFAERYVRALKLAESLSRREEKKDDAGTGMTDNDDRLT